MQKTIIRFSNQQTSTAPFLNIIGENMKMGCHVIFSCRDLTSFLGVTEHTDYTEFRAIPPKIWGSFQVKKISLPGKLDEKAGIFPVDTRRRFNVYKTSPTSYRRLIDVETTSRVYWVTLWTHGNYYSF